MTVTYRGQHRAAPPARSSARPSRLAAALAAIAISAALLLGLSGLSASPAGAAVRSPSATMTWGGSHAGNAALNWAEGNALGHWYAWGGSGPSVYDCSGLVMSAFAHGAGISLPHSTYSMLINRHLHRVYSPQRGDLAFYGSGHVEIVTAWWHQTFGAQKSGTRVGWHLWSGWWAPTAFYRVY